MRDHIPTSCFAALAFLTVCSLLPSGVRGGTGQELPLPDDIPGLIETLASPNKRPRINLDNEDRGPSYPRGFDHAAQERVFAARDKLAEKGVAAFPELIKHLRDPRYSCTVAYAAYVNLTVGTVCEQIIEGQVLPGGGWSYKVRRGKDGRSHRPPNYLEAQGGIEKWWSARSTKSLWEMRSESFKWTIEEEQRIGFPTPNEQKAFLEPLQSELRELQSQKDKKRGVSMRIRVTSVMVSDQDRALKFYTQTLGFVKKTDIPAGKSRWLTVVSPEEPSGPELLLEPTAFAPARTYQKALFDAGIPLTSFAVADIQAAYEKMKKLGVTFRTKPTKVGLVTVAVFEDTCGNLIQLAEK